MGQAFLPLPFKLGLILVMINQDKNPVAIKLQGFYLIFTLIFICNIVVLTQIICILHMSV